MATAKVPRPSVEPDGTPRASRERPKRGERTEACFTIHIVGSDIGDQSMTNERLVGDRRCWPCTIANLGIGLVIAWVPFVVFLVAGSPDPIPIAAGWGVVVTTFVIVRVVGRGYLPFAARVAEVTGLHERVRPDGRASKSTDADDRVK